mmetsp:Transcript_8565/g.21056  ORF Transcript_8565/g.21056 Transcript_8565/m.21056 type:complete len:240 (-) Transcript_8565:903-1622(-)
MPTFSISSTASSRIPAVSVTVTGYPPMLRLTWTRSLVVPGISDTIACSRSESALRRLDLPAFGTPTMATPNPSRIICPRFVSPSTFCTSQWTRASNGTTSERTEDSTTSASSSAKSMTASTCASTLTRRSLQESYLAAKSPRICFRAWDRWASVSLARRSPRASTCMRSIFPFSYALRVNSPPSAARRPSMSPRALRIPSTTMRLPWTCSSTTSSPVKLLGEGKCSASARCSRHSPFSS